MAIHIIYGFPYLVLLFAIVVPSLRLAAIRREKSFSHTPPATRPLNACAAIMFWLEHDKKIFVRP